MGDVYIAPEVARRNAREHGCGLREETARLVVHGVLHVLGHDHPDGEERTDSTMWRRQERLLARAREAGFQIIDYAEITRDEAQRGGSQFAPLALYLDHTHMSPPGVKKLLPYFARLHEG